MTVAEGGVVGGAAMEDRSANKSMGGMIGGTPLP